jgi:hypothetical protein
LGLTDIPDTAARGWRARLLAWVRGHDPVAEAQRQQIATLTETMTSLGRELAVSSEQQRLRTEALARAIEEQRTAVSALRRDVSWLRGATARQRKVSSQLLRRAELNERAAQHEQHLFARLERLANSDQPVIIGPWLGEIGFEVLYWIPFLHWAMDRFRLRRDRLLVVSRGGVSSWYAGVADQYADAFAYVTPREFRDATEAVKKQRGARGFERALVRAVMRQRGLTRARLLHPSLMYELFWSYWAYTATVRHVEAFTAHRRLISPAAADVLGQLPRDYVAVRFYFSRCLPDTPENRAFIDRILTSIVAHSHVVLLNTPFAVDDHDDFTASGSGRLHTVASHMTPETNLAVQSAAIANARAFVGTYGGYSYVAPLYGVNSIAFYSRRNFKRQHLDLAHRVFDSPGYGRLFPIDTGSAEPLRYAFGAESSVPI